MSANVAPHTVAIEDDPYSDFGLSPEQEQRIERRVGLVRRLFDDATIDQREISCIQRYRDIGCRAEDSIECLVSDLQEQWSGNSGTFSFRAMGFAISGSLNVKPSEVELRGEFPWAAKPFQGTIEQTIRERAEKLSVLTPRPGPPAPQS
jgi:hypothetical protein